MAVEVNMFENLLETIGFKRNKLSNIFSLLITIVIMFAFDKNQIIETTHVLFYFLFVAFYCAINYVFVLLSRLLSHIVLGINSVFYGRTLKKKVNNLHPKAFLILSSFFESNTRFGTFSSKDYDLDYMQELLDLDLLKTYESILPADSQLALRNALGETFVKAEINKEVFDYLSENYCEKAIRFGFILYRADVREKHRDLILKCNKEYGY